LPTAPAWLTDAVSRKKEGLPWLIRGTCLDAQSEPVSLVITQSGFHRHGQDATHLRCTHSHIERPHPFIFHSTQSVMMM
jgi:hypothetical protein